MNRAKVRDGHAWAQGFEAGSSKMWERRRHILNSPTVVLDACQSTSKRYCAMNVSRDGREPCVAAWGGDTSQPNGLGPTRAHPEPDDLKSGTEPARHPN
ncbi:MAG: hypothetical protein AB8H86_19555 [Polyangiales bacterium]